MKVYIAMAVYNPRLDWLAAQLKSIDDQEYKGLELLAIDDASPDVPFPEIEETFTACLKRIPYRLSRNRLNLGSSRTFGLLTEMAGEGAICYSDQDDIWLPGKTARLADALTKTNAALVYSGLSVIDADGMFISDSLTKVRRRLKHIEGNGLANSLLFRNFTNGTAMMLRTETAKSALPFAPDMFADHWLTLYASIKGSIAYVPEALVEYRLHGFNQSAVLTGVTNKREYLERRILPGLRRFNHYYERFAGIDCLKQDIEDGIIWFKARKSWFENGSQAGLVWGLRKFGMHAAMFELAAARLPEPVFMGLVRLVQRGLI